MSRPTMPTGKAATTLEPLGLPFLRTNALLNDWCCGLSPRARLSAPTRLKVGGAELGACKASGTMGR